MNIASDDFAAEIAGVSEAMTALLREVEIGALATLSGNGQPSVSAMHFACDGFVAYIHTFATFRKFHDLQQDGRVSYALWHEAGYAGRREVRGAQVTGRATLVREPDEIETALRVSYEQFPWLSSGDIYAGFRKAQRGGAQAFFRIDPVEAVWHDGRVSMSYRRMLTFDPDTARITAMAHYPPSRELTDGGTDPGPTIVSPLLPPSAR